MSTLDRLSQHAHWALRIALASVFVYHGLTKFPVLGSMAEMMGMPVFVVGLLAITETAAGVLIIAGGFGPSWMTRLGGLLIIPVMLGAIGMIHIHNGWNSVSMEQGMEFQFTLLMTALFFFIAGNNVQKSTTGTGEEPSTRTRHSESEAVRSR